MLCWCHTAPVRGAGPWLSKKGSPMGVWHPCGDQRGGCRGQRGVPGAPGEGQTGVGAALCRGASCRAAGGGTVSPRGWRGGGKARYHPPKKSLGMLLSVLGVPPFASPELWVWIWGRVLSARPASRQECAGNSSLLRWPSWHPSHPGHAGDAACKGRAPSTPPASCWECVPSPHSQKWFWGTSIPSPCSQTWFWGASIPSLLPGVFWGASCPPQIAPRDASCCCHLPPQAPADHLPAPPRRPPSLCPQPRGAQECLRLEKLRRGSGCLGTG